MKREYEIRLKVYSGISHGTIDEWSGLVHDWDLRVYGSFIKVTTTEEELDKLLDSLYGNEREFKVIGYDYSDAEKERMKEESKTPKYLRENVDVIVNTGYVYECNRYGYECYRNGDFEFVYNELTGNLSHRKRKIDGILVLEEIKIGNIFSENLEEKIKKVSL